MASRSINRHARAMPGFHLDGSGELDLLSTQPCDVLIGGRGRTDLVGQRLTKTLRDACGYGERWNLGHTWPMWNQVS